MKKTWVRSLLSFGAVFIAGAVASTLFLGWCLDRGPGQLAKVEIRSVCAAIETPPLTAERLALANDVIGNTYYAEGKYFILPLLEASFPDYFLIRISHPYPLFKPQTLNADRTEEIVSLIELIAKTGGTNGWEH